MVAAGGFLYFGQNLRLGSVSRMGPGYLPHLLAWVLMGLGAAIALRSALTKPEAIAWPSLRAVAVITASPIVFGLLVRHAGLVLTVFTVAVFARLAQHERIGLSFVIAPVCIAALCTVIFAYLLEQPIPLWPSR